MRELPDWSWLETVIAVCIAVGVFLFLLLASLIFALLYVQC